MLKVLIISIAIVLGVLALTVFAISKGYAYNHKVDPMPDRHKKDDDDDSDNQQ
ncbi:YtzI protein [Piscibacillus salipiscarius]|uniref:YtzI protein n=1 Tax=Piscibacillus salipiscarius TaxID=299480 RepID=A0ABW5Q824_9BACI